MRHGMELGADDYLPKPFKVDELYATVNARLRKVQSVRDQAEKKLTLLRSQISLMLPHEMRTPLNGIISNAEMLAESAAALDPQTIAEMSSEICQSGQRLERLIENFLIYAQLEIVATDPESVSRLRLASTNQPAEIVRAATIEQGELAGRLNDVLVDLVDEPLFMAEDYFKKIVVELVQNALKFSDSGTCVRVRLQPAGDQVELSVRDDGRGFSPEQITRVGLGLAISKKLVELHGGELLIESNPGAGSTVTVRLPRAQDL